MCLILQFKVAFSEKIPVYFTFVHTYALKRPPIRGYLGSYSDGGVVGAISDILKSGNLYCHIMILL